MTESRTLNWKHDETEILLFQPFYRMVKGGDVHILCYYLFSVLLFYLFYYAVVVFLNAISGEEICVSSHLCDGMCALMHPVWTPCNVCMCLYMSTNVCVDT